MDDRGRGVRRREVEEDAAEVVQGEGSPWMLPNTARWRARIAVFLVVLAELPVDDAEVAQGIALVQRVADLARDDERRLVRRLRLVILAEALVDVAEADQGIALELLVADLAADGERRLVRCLRLVVLAEARVDVAEVA